MEGKLKTFFAIVDKDPGSAYGLWFPDAPGCFSAADRDDDIVKNALEALNLHFDGDDVPAVRSISEIKSDPEVQAALSQGAYIHAIPFVRSKNKTVRANLSFDLGTLEAIDHAANERGLTRSAFLSEAAMNEISGR